jgi:arylsulfatase A-like enzyme/tetratricopeptide (TPR) repeat protein
MISARPACCLLGVLAVLGCAAERSSEPSSVVLVTIDTLRADRLGAYGGEARTPNLDALAREGVLFRNAFAQSPLTLPSHSSILTGTLPTRHGVRDNGRYRLSEEMETVAEILKAKGYATAAFVGAFPVDSRFGLDQGFDEYDDGFSRAPSRVAFAERRAADVVAAARRWLEGRKPGPYFLWLHLFDPHAPYEPPPPFAEDYEGEVAYVDESLSNLFQSVGSEALLAVTADHGEGLGEHGERTHSLFVYDSTLRIPFLLRGPGVPRGTVVEEQVRSVDIVPTLLELSGHRGACARCQGASLVPALRGETLPSAPSYAETYFPLLNLGWSELKSLRKDGWKLIAAPEPELFDLRSDPGETRNLAETDPGKLRELSAELAALSEDAVAAPASDPETVRVLRSLGYLSSAKPPVTGDRPDPKSRLAVWEGVRNGMELVARGQMGGAIAELQAAVNEEPQLLLARSYLALALFDLGRYGESAAQCAAILDREPRDFDATLLLAKSLLRSGRTAEAQALLGAAAEIDPDSPEPWVELAQAALASRSREEAEAYLAKARERDEEAPPVLVLRGKMALLAGDSASSEALFRKALGESPFEEDARVQLGNLLLTQRRLGEAEGLYREGLTIRPEAASFHLGLGHSRALAGKMGEAIPLFEKALTLDPKSTTALNSLGFIYIETGNANKGVALLRRSLEIQPDQPELVGFLRAR